MKRNHGYLYLKKDKHKISVHGTKETPIADALIKELVSWVYTKQEYYLNVVYF